MTLYLFKYCLPVLLGYTLFIGLSGRINPLLKPEYPEERPSWFLGLWTGLSVAIVTMVGLHMAYSMTLQGVKELLPPTALFMTVLLIPGFLVYFNYRRIVASELQTSRTLRASQEMLKTAVVIAQDRPDDWYSEFTSQANETSQQAPNSIHNVQDNMRTKDTNSPVDATFLDSADLQTLHSHQQEAANNESALYDPGYLAASDPALEDYLDETIFEELHYTTLELDDTTLADFSLMDSQSGTESDTVDAADADRPMNMESNESMSRDSEDRLAALSEAQLFAEDAYDDELLFDPEPLSTDEGMSYLFELDTLPAEAESNSWLEIDNLVADEQIAERPGVNSTGPVEVLSDNTSFLSELELLESDLQSDDAVPRIPDGHESALSDTINAQEKTPMLATLETYLAEERSAHQETASQLYATRKALATLTSGSEGPEPDKTASFLQMKEELSQSRKQQSTLEAHVQQESSKRLEMETMLAELQRNLIMSKQDVRRSTAARAKALSTANKAIAFARQTLQVRALLEEELDQVRETLSHRQTTISSLINELEHEKERTQEEVSFMVQQLVLHEQQLKARRNLEDAADGFDKPLPARTPKRIETQSLSPDM